MIVLSILIHMNVVIMALALVGLEDPVKLQDLPWAAQHVDACQILSVYQSGCK